MGHKKQEGQIMILSVLLISSAVLGAAALASMLVLFQLRGASGAEASAQAVFAADAGMERGLYNYFHEGGCEDGGDTEKGEELENESTYVSILDCDSRVGHSLGKDPSEKSARSFRISFNGLCEIGRQTDECP